MPEANGSAIAKTALRPFVSMRVGMGAVMYTGGRAVLETRRHHDRIADCGRSGAHVAGGTEEIDRTRGPEACARAVPAGRSVSPGGWYRSGCPGCGSECPSGTNTPGSTQPVAATSREPARPGSLPPRPREWDPRPFRRLRWPQPAASCHTRSRSTMRRPERLTARLSSTGNPGVEVAPPVPGPSLRGRLVLHAPP